VADGAPITLRLTIVDPVPGVTYSLQDKSSAPMEPRVAANAPLSFDVPIRLADGPRFLGPFVRSEGPQRRFVHVALGANAGDRAARFGGRAKIDIHDIAPALLRQALTGQILEARLPGRNNKGGPALATLRPLDGWRAI
jgi:hypothetical protein